MVTVAVEVHSEELVRVLEVELESAVSELEAEVVPVMAEVAQVAEPEPAALVVMVKDRHIQTRTGCPSPSHLMQ